MNLSTRQLPKTHFKVVQEMLYFWDEESSLYTLLIVTVVEHQKFVVWDETMKSGMADHV